MGLLKSGFMQPVEDTTPIEESEETNPGGATLISDIPDDAFGHVLFWLPPLTNLAAARVSFGDMCTRTFGFAKDTGQFKGILKAVIHDVDELVYDEDAGGDVPLQFTIQRDFSKNEKRPLRWCDKEGELDLPPY